jgi:hypothetical protein
MEERKMAEPLITWSDVYPGLSHREYRLIIQALNGYASFLRANLGSDPAADDCELLANKLAELRDGNM